MEGSSNEQIGAQGQSLPTSFPYTQTPTSTSGGDWREETYQKIKALKEKYSLILSTLFQNISDKLREIDSLPHEKMLYEPVAKLRTGKATLELVLVFLNVSRSCVSEIHRDKFSLYEEYLLRFTEYHQNVTRKKMQQKQVHLLPSLPTPLNRTEAKEPITERPIDRLIKAIQSSSPESLAQSVSEMRSVISLTDRTRYRLQQGGDTNPTKRFKSSVTTMPIDSTASSGSKVNKIEPGCALLQEITEINGRLVETVVSICNENVSQSEVTSGTVVVKCSYVPVALSATFKALYESGHVSQIQPLRLLVPESYPCSPIILEKTLLDCASVHKYEDLSARARSRFGLFMREYSEPMSLKEIAKVWDECARATMVEYAERHGGGTFSSKYGRWESVLRA